MRYRIAVAVLLALSLTALSVPVWAQGRPGIDEFIRRAGVVIAAQNSAGSPLPATDPRVHALLASATGEAVFGQGPDTAQDLNRLVGDVSACRIAAEGRSRVGDEGHTGITAGRDSDVRRLLYDDAHV
ncbi:hypothetical protein [Luteibacter aegosomatissinici]|uniref:hypothetical protein n=1 Tax=Luteibacter aegosomatissinici TaxID=2911539 RepID=UPI001FFA281B|nr:hypothetical protein [Luteibacter aegosomatissinici]UPG96187.1 hypothetical protein L2Y97_08785 [Luteibacter aegosomatissinici]